MKPEPSRSHTFAVLLSLAGLWIAAAGCDRSTEPTGPADDGATPDDRATPRATSSTTDAGTLALVTNHDDNTVSVIDVAARSEETTIDVGSGPNGVAVTPDGTLALVANHDDNTVSVIDVAARSEETTIDVEPGPAGVAITPDGALGLVTGKRLSVIDIAAREQETTIEVGSGAYRVAITPDGSLALVTNADFVSENVSVVDIAAREEETTIDVVEVPQGIAITPDGSRAFVADFFFWSLRVIDIPARKRVDPVPGGIDVGRSPDGVAITPDGSLALVANSADDAVSVVDLASQSETATIPVGANPANVAIRGPAVIPVDLDVRPDSDRNPVNPRSRGLLPVAVLTTDDFDAARIDPETVTLGDEEGDDTPVAERHHGRLHASLEDVDHDGDRDLVLKFEIDELVENDDLDPETKELVLTGETQDGTPVRGSDGVEVVEGHTGHGPRGH